MYTVASPGLDSNPRGGGQLPNPNEYNYMLTSAKRGEEALTPTPIEILISGVTNEERGHRLRILHAPRCEQQG